MNNKYKVLVVEDEQNICTLVATMLESSGYQVVTAGSCASGKTMYFSYQPDLVLLDLGLPDQDGLELLQVIRADSPTPVIVLSARNDEGDKVEALDMGANDYVTKPFGAAELLARVRSALRSSRHSGHGTEHAQRFTLGDLVIDYDARRVTIGGTEVKLTQTEYNIVSYLAEHNGKVMTYSAIIKAVWGYAGEGSVKCLQVNMANIRKKFGVRPGRAGYILNELGVGYRMNDEQE